MLNTFLLKINLLGQLHCGWKLFLLLATWSCVLFSGNPDEDFCKETGLESLVAKAHRSLCFLPTVWQTRRFFILNCQIYHKPCFKESDKLIKFTTTLRNHSVLSNWRQHISTENLQLKTPGVFAFFFFFGNKLVTKTDTRKTTIFVIVWKQTWNNNLHECKYVVLFCQAYCTCITIIIWWKDR